MIAKISSERRHLSLLVTSLLSVLLVTSAAETVAQQPNNFLQGLRILAEDGVLRRNDSPIQTFHIGSEFALSEERHFFIYWPEARRLFRFPVTASTSEFWLRPTLMGDQRIDLEADVVRSIEDFPGSTYLQSTEWTKEKIEDCLNGETVVITIELPERIN